MYMVSLQNIHTISEEKERNEKLLTQTLLIITSATFIVDLVLLYNKFDWHVLAYVSNGSKEHQIFSP